MKAVIYITIAVLSSLLFMLWVSILFAQSYTTKLETAVVKITSSSEQHKQYGTGFVWFVKQDTAYLLTAYHVIADSDGFPLKSIVVEFEADIMQYDAAPHSVDRDADIAILSLEQFPENIGMLKLGNSKQVSLGDDVYILGYPGGGRAQMQKGSITTLREANKIILQDINPDEGQSGSPLINEASHEVVGIVLQRPAKTEDQYALEIDAVKMFLNKERAFKQFIDGIDTQPAMFWDLSEWGGSHWK